MAFQRTHPRARQSVGRWIVVVVSLAALSGLAGCSDPTTHQKTGEIRVVAAFAPVAELAERVGGRNVSVRNLSGGGVEPHELELTADQIDAVTDADVVLYFGGGFQPAVDSAVKQRKGISIDLLSTVPTTGNDPHVWLDPVRYHAIATAIADTFAEFDPTSSKEFQANLSKVSAEVDELKAEFEVGLETCKRREIITAHEAFGYLAARYNLILLSASGLVPDSEPDASVIASLTDAVRRTGATTVFTEELAGDDVAEVLARESGARVNRLATIETYTADDRKAGATYASKMRANLQALRTALECR